MSLTDLQDTVLAETKEIRSWFWRAFSDYEGRRKNEITSLIADLFKKIEAELGPIKNPRRVWEYFELLALDSLEEPEHISEELGICAEPPLEFGEHALLIGLLFAKLAVIQSEKRTHKSDLLALLYFSAALDARSFWTFFRGIDRCRHPDEKTLELQAHMKSSEFRLWHRARQSAFGRKGAEKRSNQPGGFEERKAKLRAIWASDKYRTRDECAEREHAALGMAHSTARKALRGTPNPNKRNQS